MAWLEDLAWLVTQANVAVVNTNLFFSSGAQIPPGPGPFMLLVETFGLEPERLHSDDTGLRHRAAYERPGAQVVVRGTNWEAVRAMAVAAWLAIDGKHNATVNGTFYREILAQQQPFDMGPDDTKRVRVVFNVLGVKALP